MCMKLEALNINMEINETYEEKRINMTICIHTC